jgi:hypothetical protein
MSSLVSEVALPMCGNMTHLKVESIQQEGSRIKSSWTYLGSFTRGWSLVI